MNKPKNNLLKNLGLALSVLFVLSIVSPAAEVLSPQEMKSLERFLEIDLKGYFFYFSHNFSADSSPVFFYQILAERAGGQFFPYRFDKEEKLQSRDGSYTYWYQWYRVEKKNGSVDLAALPVYYCYDPLLGYCQPDPIDVYTLDGTEIRKRTLSGTFAELLLAPDFKSIEPVYNWYLAKRRDDGIWTTRKENMSFRDYFDKPSPLDSKNPGKLPTKADSPRLVSLRKTLLEHFHSKIPGTVKFVFDRDSKGEIVHAFVADSALPLFNGLLLWTSFHWTDQGWKSVPREGVECPSGKIPDSFLLSTSGFFVLCCQREEPRLAVMRNAPNGPVEPFWEKALSNPVFYEKSRIDTSHYLIPDHTQPPEEWPCSMPPYSIAQALYDPWQQLRIIIRVSVIGLDVVAPLWKSEP